MNNLEERIKNTVRDIPDFPKKGILFKDITPLLLNVSVSQEITDALAGYWEDKSIDVIAGIESRGLMWGHSLAQKLGVPFVPIRKKGKLPAPAYSFKYDLEYGSAEIEMHQDAISPGQNVLVHDDLLATGGTALGAAELVRIGGGKVSGFSFIVELTFLSAISKLLPISEDVHALVKY
ncbi:MAG: adenine phosphoribosyltransferase [Bacteroidota bacterium]